MEDEMAYARYLERRAESVSLWTRRARMSGRVPSPWTLNGCTLDELTSGQWNTGRPLHPDYRPDGLLRDTRNPVTQEDTNGNRS